MVSASLARVSQPMPARLFEILLSSSGFLTVFRRGRQGEEGGGGWLKHTSDRSAGGPLIQVEVEYCCCCCCCRCRDRHELDEGREGGLAPGWDLRIGL